MATIKTDAELLSQVQAGIKVNGNKEITPAIHKSIEDNIIASKVSIKDGGNVIQSLVGYNSELTLTDRKNFVYKGWVDDAIAAIDFTPFLKRDGSNSPTANLNFNGFGITNLGTLTRVDGDDSERILIIPGQVGLKYENTLSGNGASFDLTESVIQGELIGTPNYFFRFDVNGFGITTNAGLFKGFIKTDNLLNNVTYQLPQKTAGSYTFALINADQTFTGLNTFDDTISINGILVTGDSSIDQFIVNSGVNSIPDGSPTATISGGGRSTFPNIIGIVNGLPNGTGLTPTGWAADSTYPGGGAADVANICGGYDHIVNQEAGTICGGGHNFIKYNANGHSIIGGGSYNVISAGRSGIFSGYGNTITGSSKLLSFIGGGTLNNIAGNYCSIPGGQSHSITGDYSVIIGGADGVVSGSGSVLLKDVGSGSFTLTKSNACSFLFSGGVGIGTGNPAENFHIKTNESAAGSSLMRLDNSGTVGNQVGFEFWSSPTDTTTATRTGRIYAVWDGASYSNTRITLQTMASGNTLVDTMTLKNAKVGIGQTTPTALLHLAAGSATANTAPLKLTSGTNLTTGETGAVEYNGTNLFFTRTGTTRENIVCASAVNSVSPTAQNRTITVNIDGVTLYVSAKTTND